MTKTVMPYRFPPLHTAQTLPEDRFTDPVPAVDSQSVIAAATEEGFAQGFAKGHAQGLEQGIIEGKQQGYEAGEAKGLSTSKALFETASAPLEQIVAALQDFYAQAEQQQKNATLALVTRIAGLVIQQEIATRPELLMSWIDDKLTSEAINAQPYSIRVSEADFNALQALAPEKITEWHLHPQADLPRGECVIDTEQQHFDLGCQQRLDACLSTLAESLDQPDPAA